MVARYIALVDTAGVADPRAAAGHRAWARDLRGFEVIHEDDRILLVAADSMPVRRAGSAIVLGSLFEREQEVSAPPFTQSQARNLLRSRGELLVERFWGPYVAVLPDESGEAVEVLRAPLGELPAYHAVQAGTAFIASDVGLMVACGLSKPGIEWTTVARHLAMGVPSRRDTCLSGIHELSGGERLTIASGRCWTSEIWSPWTFTTPERQIESPADAARLLRTTAVECVAARASEFSKITLLLSGGLDSSIVAACLASRGMAFHCLNLVTHEATGDERAQAHQVADTLGVGLTEAWREVERIDVGWSDARRLPRPALRMFVQESTRLAHMSARRSGSQAVFDGSGGDNIFCSLQSGGPAADRLLRAGPGMAFWRTVDDISQLASSSLWAVARDALARAWFGKRALRVWRDISFLTPQALAALEDAKIHPWLEPPAGTLPGKAMHVRLLAQAQRSVESTDPEDSMPRISPLLSQALVELCLSIPSWTWLDGGNNRVVARRAFAKDLPASILWRRAKGTPDGFVAQIFETHRAAIRSLLGDGELVRGGLVDLPEVLRVLDTTGPVHGDEFRRILQLADVEAWLQSWAPGSG